MVLSPGIHSETAFDQAYLASVLGFPLVESADLVVRDGKLWMRSLGTLKRVDVVLRRVDAEYADPLDLRADSRLGVVGLVEVLRRGAVTVVNTLGSGILESPGLLRFLPDLAETLLGETPLLETAPVYWGGINTERSHLLSRLGSLLIRPVNGGDAIVGPALTADAAQGTRCPDRGHSVAVGRPGSAAVLLGPNRFPAGRTVLGQRRHAAVHGGPAGRLCTDDRRARLSAGTRQRRLYDENRCSQGYLGANADACHRGKDPDVAARRTARDHAEPDARGELTACAVGPVLDGAIRRARGEHGQAVDRHPRALSRIPLPAGHGGQRVCTGAAGRAGRGSPEPTPARRRLPRDDRDRTDDAVVADRRPAPPRRAGAIGRAARTGGARSSRPDVQRHLDGVGRRRTRGAAPRPVVAGVAHRGRGVPGEGAPRNAWPGCWRCRGWPPSRWCRTSAGR